MKPLSFPRDLLRFLYWVFFKPVTLDHYIYQIDSKVASDAGVFSGIGIFSNADIFTLWKHSKERPEFRTLIHFAIFHILIMPWPLTFFSANIFMLLGFGVDWFGVIWGVFVGIACSVIVGVVFGLTLGVAFGVAGGVAFGVAFGVAGGVEVVMGGVTFGVIGGIAFGFAVGLAVGVEWGMDWGVVWGVAFGMVWGVAGSVIWGGVGGAMWGISALIGYFRLLNYIIETSYSFLLSHLSARRTLNLSPVMWDELIWLPLLGLDRQIISVGKENREEGIKCIAYVASSFRQGWAAQRALLELTVYDVRTSKNLDHIASISETLSWLPPKTRAASKNKGLLLGLEAISKHTKASIESDTLYNRQEQLRLALNATRSMRQDFAFDKNQQIARLMSPALEVWESLLASEFAALQKQESIPNVYVAGRPLDAKSKVFRDRRDVFKSLEQELVSPAEQRPAILLFGARRTGKTSVLRQLPETLGPQVIPVAVDLQESALDKDAAGLLYKIAEKIRSDALQFRRMEFGELSRATLDASPYSAFAEWLKKIQETIGERWILLNLDEYEYLEKMLNDGRVDERLFQMLRTFLQNHPRLTLLLSGAHTFEDLNPIWSHHLINARVVKINPLSESEARELITKPIPDYPLVYSDKAVQDILDTTACQPYLIQAVCRDLVNAKNDAHHFHANQKDVSKALESVLVSATAYFQDLWEGPDTDEAQRVIMGAIARAKNGSLGLKELNKVLEKENFMQASKVRQRALRILGHRDILKADKNEWSFQTPLVRTWIRVKQFGLKK